MDDMLDKFSQRKENDVDRERPSRGKRKVKGINNLIWLGDLVARARAGKSKEFLLEKQYQHSQVQAQSGKRRTQDGIRLVKLFQLINMAVNHKLWAHVQLSKGGPKLYHLTLADDLLLFARAYLSQVEPIRKILQLFCKCSHQKVRADKT
ncbi:hypothetical protein CR513_58964, partial [Mucuna pruriens]